jgi:hypothetical protein
MVDVPIRRIDRATELRHVRNDTKQSKVHNMIEEKVNEYGQRQFINSANTVVKIGDKYLEVRLIETEKYEDVLLKKKDKRRTKPMPRARFVDPSKDAKIHYMVEREQLIKLKNESTRTKRRNRKSSRR